MSITKELLGNQVLVPESDETLWGSQGTTILVDLIDAINLLHDVVAVTATSYAPVQADGIIFADATAANIAINLPTLASQIEGKQFLVIKSDNSANTVTVSAQAGELINDTQTKILDVQYDAIVVRNVLTKWAIQSLTQGGGTVFSDGLSVYNDTGVTNGEHEVFEARRSATETGIKTGYNANGASETSAFLRSHNAQDLQLGTAGKLDALVLKDAGGIEARNDGGVTAADHDVLQLQRLGASTHGVVMGYKANGASDSGAYIHGRGTADLEIGTDTNKDTVIVKDAGGLDVNNGALTVATGGLTVTAGGVGITSGDLTLTAGKLGLRASQEITLLTGGTVAISGGNHFRVDTFSDAGTDDLDSITGSVETDLIVLRAENVARVVTVKDGTGNIQLNDGDYALDDANSVLVLFYNGTNWIEWHRSAATNVNQQLVQTAKTGAYTAVALDLVDCDCSSGSFTVTLPASPGANARIGILLESTNLPAQPTKPNTVTIARNGNSIDSASSDVVLFVEGDYYELQFDGSNNWIVIAKRITAHHGKMRRDAVQSLTEDANVKLLLDATEINVGGMGDAVTNDRFDIRRAGRYRIAARGGMAGAAIDMELRTMIYAGASAVLKTNGSTFTPVSITSPDSLIDSVSADFTLAVDDVVELRMRHSDSAARNSSAAIESRPEIDVLEIL